MFTEIKLIVWIWLLRICVPSYTSSSSISTWMTYESNSSYKWWRYSTLSSSGYAWDASDTSTYWGGDASYRWSSDSSYYLPQNSKKLLWPTDSFNCNKSNFLLIYINIKFSTINRQKWFSLKCRLFISNFNRKQFNTKS